MDTMTEALEELEEEQAEISALLSGLDESQWASATPSDGWDVRDQVSHLADTNEVAIDTMLDGPRSLNVEVKSFATPEDFTEAGCEKGRKLSPLEVLEWWQDSSEEMNAVFRKQEPTRRVPWGLGMTARTLVTARFMEHWAHATDIKTAVGVPITLEPRLKSVAWLVTKAVPYALMVAQAEQANGSALKVELKADDETWVLGDPNASDVIRGDALEYCLVGIQRRRAVDTSLVAEGPLAQTALRSLRAFL